MVLVDPLKYLLNQIEDGVFKGEMIFNSFQLLGSINTTQGNKATQGLSRNSLKNVNFLWPDGEVKYEIDPKYKNSDQDFIRTTLRNLQFKLNSCIRFIESKEDKRVFITNNVTANNITYTGCMTPIGYQFTNMPDQPTQNLILSSPKCITTGTIEKMFLYILGIFHTEARSDRDSYIRIMWGNIISGKEQNFRKYPSNILNDHGLPYDYNSLMHSGRYYGSCNGKITIKTLDKSKQHLIGQVKGVSEGDILLVKTMYGCLDTSYTIKCKDTTTIITTPNNITTPSQLQQCKP